MKYTEDMLKIQSMEPGEMLYHYTSLDGLLGIIQNKEWWVTKWNFLNDSAEFRTGKQVCRKVLEKHGVPKRLIDSIVKQIDSEFDSIDDYYVLSFSLKKDSQLMWTAYANQVGVCLGFEYKKLSKSFDDIIMWDGKVIYDSEEQERVLEQTIEEDIINESSYKSVNSWEDLARINKKQEKALSAYIEVIVSLYSMFFKDSFFEGEEEYRIIFTEDKKRYEHPEIIYFRNRLNTIIPYMKRKIKNIKSLKEITVGPINDVDVTEKGIETLLRSSGSKAKVYKSRGTLRF